MEIKYSDELKQYSLDNSVNLDEIMSYIIEEKLNWLGNKDNVSCSDGILNLSKTQEKLLKTDMANIKEWVENALQCNGKMYIDMVISKREELKKQDD
jgi:hypothetical protein